MIDVEAALQIPINKDLFDGTHFEVQWTVPASIPYFEGHFPHRPILPAVAIIDASTLILTKILPRKFRLSKVLSAKFSSPVTPGKTVQIILQQKDENTWHCEWTGTAQMALFLDFSTPSKS